MRGIAAFAGRVEPGFVDLTEPPQPAPGQVLCRTLELGVCGTDREILHSREPMSPPGCGFLVLGHECLAQVEAVGQGVREYRAGDLVLPLVRRAAVDAPHRPDMLAMGNYTERGIVLEHGFSTPYWLDEPRHLLPIAPAQRPFAILVEPLTCSEKSMSEITLLQRARFGEPYWQPSAPPRVLITGLGPIAFGALLGSLARGWPTTVYGRDDPTTFRAQMVVELGGEYLPAQQANFDPADVERDGYDLLLECTGDDELAVRAAAIVRARGAIAWLGSTRRPEPAAINVARMMRDSLLRNHLILGSVNAALRDFSASLANLTRFHEQMPNTLARLITSRVAQDEALWHYEHRHPQGIKTVVEF
ncbi:MAG: alcohol dehydrogenase catalytic domain-containing protein [Pirellulales bacterium]|nr:alcohol dehydrogenase catalytic domain-containing protein [Pirellulales bacterium]